MATPSLDGVGAAAGARSALAQAPTTAGHGQRERGIVPTALARGRFQGIEVGRGIAAFLVVLHHAGNIIAQPQFYGVWLWGGPFRNFNVGVDFFFVLSGFIIAWVHADDLGRPERMGHYALRRFLRIYPPYWGVVIPLAATYLVTGRHLEGGAAHFLTSLILLPYPTQPILGVAWTLVHEMMFYVVFGLLIWGGVRLAWALPAWAVAIVAAQAFKPLPFPVSTLLSAFNLEFLMGVGAAFVLRSRRIPAPRLLTFAGSAAFLGFMLFVPDIQDVSIVGRLAFGLSAMLWILGMVEWERSRGFSAPRLLLGLGAASYATYLIHGLALSAAVHVMTRIGRNEVPLPLVFLILVAAGVVTGALYYLLAEKPLTRATKRGLDRIAALRGAPARSRSGASPG